MRTLTVAEFSTLVVSTMTLTEVVCANDTSAPVAPNAARGSVGVDFPPIEITLTDGPLSGTHNIAVSPDCNGTTLGEAGWKVSPPSVLTRSIRMRPDPALYQ